MQETANKNKSKEPEFFGDKLSEYRAAVGGAALGLATNEAKKTGGKITVAVVNKYTKRLNKIAGFIIIGYLLFIAYVVFSNAGRVISSEELMMKENKTQLNEIIALCKAENLMSREQCNEAKIAAMQIKSN
jgi:hypothetical protein